MSPQQTIEAAKLMTEWAQGIMDGKPIEVECSNIRNIEHWATVPDPNWDWAMFEYRRKPQPKRVPLEAKDVPPGSVFRIDGWEKGMHRTYFQIGLGGIWWSADQNHAFGWIELMKDGWLISRDNGKTWEGCWKEEV